MRSSRINDFMKFNEEFCNENEKELAMLLTLLNDLRVLEFELNKEIEENIKQENFPSQQEFNQRLKIFKVLNDISAVSARVSQLNNQLYMLTGE